MIRLSHVAKGFHGHKVLSDISFSISPGEKVSLVGPGGCGKTLILKILLGLESQDQGEVELMGQDMLQEKDPEVMEVRKKVGMAFQQGGLFDFMTVKENLFFAMEHMTAYTPDYMLQQVRSLLAAVKLSRTENMYPHELSGGMKRRVGIARALCTDPRVAIFDEPTSGLDPVTSTIILNMIDELALSRQEEKTLMISTSNVEIAIRFAKRIILIRGGVVAADGDWTELLLSSDPWVQNFLGVRFIGLDIDYVKGLGLPESFINRYWRA